MRKRILRIAMAVLMLAVMVPSALAATYEEINQDQVFLKQEQRGTCTLASTAMMLRRAALLNGDENWAQITEASCRQAFWIAGCGLPYNFSYGEMTVSHDTLPGGEANKDILIDLLAKLLKGLFGYGYWLAGPAMLLAGGILLLHRGRPVTLRTTCALLLPLLAGALFHTIFAGGDYALNGWGVLKNLWTAGLALKAGGAVSGLLAEAAVLAVSKVVSLFLFGLLLAVLLLAGEYT